jgi:hypothetical protein
MEKTEILTRLIPTEVPAHVQRHGYLRCDTCLRDIPPQSTVGAYASGLEASGELPIRMNVMFCPKCRVDEFPIETQGVHEILLHAKFGEKTSDAGEPMLSDPEVTATSKGPQGTRWRYDRVWETVTDVSFDKQRQQLNGAATPAHVWGIFGAADIDIWDLIDEEGEYVASDEETAKARGRFRSLGESMR